MSTQTTKNNLELIFEIIFSYIVKYRIILLSSIAFIIILVAGIGIYQLSIANADKDFNTDFESAMVMYDIAKSQGSNPEVIIDVASKLQKVSKDAKSKELRLRASYALGLIYYDIKNYSESQKYLETVSKSRGFYLAEPASYSLANVYIEQNKYDEALSTLENANKMYPESYLEAEMTLTIADLHIAQGNRDLAITVLTQWIQNNSEEDNVYNEEFITMLSLIENNIY